jgi:mono/diheme cytochrome c family protein
MKNLLIVALALAATLAGCRGQASKEPPIVPIRNMHQQPRYNVQSASPFFSDGRSMRPLVEGVVAVEMETNAAIDTGRTPDNANWVGQVPNEVVAGFGGHGPMLERGQERFGVYCVPCHGGAGDGQGIVTVRAAAGGVAFNATNLHQASLRAAPDGQIFATISNGARTMPAYHHNIPVPDRWAIVSYVRALQLTGAGPATARNDAAGAAAQPQMQAAEPMNQAAQPKNEVQ